MRIITKTLLTIIAILFANACATTPTMKRLVGEYEVHYGGSNTGTSKNYVLLENGVLEVFQTGGGVGRGITKKRAEAKWAIVDGELHVEFDNESVEVFRINMHTDESKKQTPTLWDGIIRFATIDKDGNRKDLAEQHVFKKIK